MNSIFNLTNYSLYFKIILKRFLLQLFRIWFEWVNLVNPSSYFSDAYCKMANYLDVSCVDFSNWLIAAITGERLIVPLISFESMFNLS